jgi:hypothetical protein
MKRLLVLFLVLPAGLAAGTRIQDTVKYPDGTPASGRAEVTLFTSFFTPGNEPIGAGKQTVTITNGVVDITLEPNDTATPSGTSYAVRFFLTRGTYFQYWVVPTSATPLKIKDVAVTTIPTPALTVALSQLSSLGALKGDVIAFGTAWGRLPVGLDGQVLTADSLAPRGVKWSSPAGGGILSLNGLNASSQSFANDTNVTISSSGSTHTLGWTGTLAKARQHAQTAYKDEANVFLQPQTIQANTTDLLTLTNTGPNDWITLFGNKSRFKVWNNGANDLAELQAKTFFGSGAGLDPATVPTSALVDGANLPTTGEKAALSGTSGTPGSGNKYVTNSDSRMSDARTPLAHGSTHKHGGADEVAQATAAANAIPKADGSGRLDKGWQPVLVGTVDQGYFFPVTIQAPQSSGATNTFGANNVRVWQYVLPFAVTVNQMSFEVVATSGTGTSLGLGIWDASCSNLVLNSGVMTAGGGPDINVAGVKTKTISGGPVTLNPGVYWLAMTTDSTSLTLRSTSLPSQAISMLNAQTNKKFAQGGNNGSAGAFPASCGSLTVAASNQPPIVLLER